MSGPFGSSQLFGVAAGDAAYVPKGAMWFDSGDGTELTAATRSSDSSNKKRNIISVWRKGSSPQTTSGSHLIGVGSPDYDRIELDGTQLQYTFDGGGSSYSIVSDAILRDPTGWQHLVISFDSTQISGSRVSFYYNGVLLPGQTYHSGGEVPADFESELLGNSITTYLCGGGGGAGTINSYLSEFIAIDGKSIQNGDVAISAFGTENSDGVWVPVDPTTVFASGSDFGNNGFYLDFADSSDFGNDVSGNANDFTATNTTTANWTYDRPVDSGTDTGNYCILDPNQNRGPGTLSNAYLTWSTSSTWAAIKATIPCLEDGCYWEATCDTVSGTARQTYCGLMEQNKTYDSGSSNQDRFVTNASGGMEWYSGSGGYATITGASALSATDVLMFAYKNGSIWVGKNGTWFTSGDPDSNTGAIETGLNSVGEGRWTPSTGQNYTGAWTFNFGGSDFAYPPGVTYNTVGFNPINTSNFPAPTVTNPSLNVLPVLYEGNGTGQRVGNFIPFTDSKTVNYSARFDAGDSDYLSKTFSGAGNRKKFTISCWFKRVTLDTLYYLYAANASGPVDYFYASFTTSNYLRMVFQDESDTTKIDWTSDRAFEDTSAWHNLVVSVDTDKASPTFQVFYDGVELTNWTKTTNTLAQNDESSWNADRPHAISARSDPTGYSSFYISEFVNLDGQVVTSASDFGQTDTSTNRWIPKDVSGLTFGTNGFYLPMTAGNQLGMDNKGGSNTEEDALEVFLCSFDGVDGATTATDASSYGTTMTFTSGAALSNAQSKWGTTSLLLDGTNDFVALSPEYLLIGPNTNFTFEAWIYLNSNSATMDLFALRSGAGNYYQLGLHFASSIGARFADGSGGVDFNQGSNSGWSTGQWYHIAYVKNGTAYAIYRDGTSIASTTDSHTWDLYGLAAATAGIGTADSGWGNFFDGYVSDARISMKAVYTANFTAPTGAFSAPTAANNFLPYNVDKINDSNQMYDTPTRNYNVMDGTFLGASWGATLASGLTQGNLKFTRSSGDTMGSAFMGAGSGKWYVEIVMDTVVTSNSNMAFGIVDLNNSIANQNFATGTNSYAYRNYTGSSTSSTTGQKMPRATTVTAGTGYAAGDVLGIAFDLDAGYMWAAKNNTWFNDADGSAGNPTAGTFPLLTGIASSGPLNPAKWAMSLYFNDNHAATFNFGQWRYFDGGTTTLDTTADGYFKYTPPTDFLAFHQDNLAANTAGITGFSWIKNRDAADDHILEDRVRGIYKYLISNDTDIEVTNTNSVQRFLQQGVQVGNMDAVNTSAESFVLWNWVANGTGTTNTEGTITSTVSANTTAGFSIATYTGSSNTTFGHGLSTAPKLVMIKRRDVAAQWAVWHTSLTSTQYYLNLDDAGAEADYGSTFISTSSTLVTIDASSSLLNNTGDTYVCYCWAEVEGYSKFGSYEGNTNNDGPCIYLGFKPSILIWKNIDSGSTSWRILDNKRNPYNPVNHRLFPNDSGVESDNSSIDFTANGFRVITNSSDVNTNTIVYAAWAENPFGGSGVAQAKAR